MVKKLLLEKPSIKCLDTDSGRKSLSLKSVEEEFYKQQTMTSVSEMHYVAVIISGRQYDEKLKGTKARLPALVQILIFNISN